MALLSLLRRAAIPNLLTLAEAVLTPAAMRSIKFHSLIDHACDDILNHGNPYSYDAQASERAHKGPKAAYRATNKQQAEHAFMSTIVRIHEVRYELPAVRPAASMRPPQPVLPNTLLWHFICSLRYRPRLGWRHSPMPKPPQLPPSMRTTWTPAVGAFTTWQAGPKQVLELDAVLRITSTCALSGDPSPQPCSKHHMAAVQQKRPAHLANHGH